MTYKVGDKLIVKSSRLSDVDVDEIGEVIHIDADGDLKVKFSKRAYIFDGNDLTFYGYSEKCKLDIFQLNKEPENHLIEIL